jgi:hypothetical protein
MHGRNNNN